MNTYNLKARTYPLLITILPIVLIGIIYSINLKSIYELLVSFGLTTALFFLFSQLGRDRGKKIEKKIWETWGGAPTTQLLRFSNKIIDKHSKTRYHNSLKELTKIGNEIDEIYESNNTQQADEIYQSWIKYLITNTRDTKKYNLLFQELINYGFRRNLFGLKIFSVAILATLILVVFFYTLLIPEEVIFLTKEFLISELILLIILFFWLIVIRVNWIKNIAFSYAERLLETIDTINKI